MKINNPQITVLMPAYNAAAYIGEAIASVLCQTFADFELLIVNDGSIDDTAAVIRTFTDPRIVLINQENQGVAAALNTGLAHARAPYIARFDADDICMETRLQKQFDFMETHPDYVLIGSDVEYMLETGEFLFSFQCTAHSNQQIKQSLYVYCPFIHSSVMYRKQIVLNAGGYSVNAHNFEDYLLWANIAGDGKFLNIPEPLIKVRLNASSVTIDEKWRGERFRELKRRATLRGSITEEEGNELLDIIKRQNVQHVKEGAYHALCGKKFLANNYQPVKARSHVKKAIRIRPFRLDNYLLYTASYLPEKLILWLHSKSPNRL